MVTRERFSPARKEIDGEVLTKTNLPAELQRLFAKTPLLHHEDPKLYWELWSRIEQDIQPSDTIAWLFCKDIVDLSWEIVGVRRLKAALLDAGRRGAVAEIFGPVGKFSSSSAVGFQSRWDCARDRSDEWFDPKNKQKVASLLNKYGLDEDSITAMSFSTQVAACEALERIAAALEFRRNNALRGFYERGGGES